MDKNTLIGFALIGAVLIGFTYLSRPSEEEMQAQKRAQDSIQAITQKKAAEQKLSVIKEQKKLDSVSQDSSSILFMASKGKEDFIKLHNEVSELTLSTKGGRICSALLKKYNDQKGKPVVLFDKNESQLNFSFEGKNENIITKDLYFQAVNVTDSSVTMRLPITADGYIDFNYSMIGNSYMVNFSIDAHNVANLFSPSLKNVDIDWNQKTRQLEKGYSFENRYTTLTYKKTNKGTDYLTASGDKSKDFTENMDWICFKNQFFATTLIANQDFSKTNLISSQETEGSGYLKDFSASMKGFFDPTGKQPTVMQYYIGPNKYFTLKAANKLTTSKKDLQLQELVDLGWPIIRWINRWFTVYLFDWLTGWGLSMGVVLLLMTIIVKTLVYPTTYKSYISSAKMRVLKPKIEEINQKYPKQEDAMKKQQETMALYSKYGVSPMGGCLPLLIQTPVFLALFNFVPNAIELRQQSFLWADDLSSYDALVSWNTTLPLIGNHISLFCLLFALAQIVNTWITTQQQDTGQQQMAAMKWMMYLMPIVFIFVLNDYSSGLNYYYFISGLISIITMFILKQRTDEKALLAKLEARYQANKDKPKKRANMMEKLEALQKEQERLNKERANKKK